MKYRDLFGTQYNFLRSTRLELDKNYGSSSFVVTPIFVNVLNRVVDGLLGDEPRAISITGPYGTGKSTTILEILRLLESDQIRIADFRKKYPELPWHSALPKVFSITLTGTQGPIAPNIHKAITQWAFSQNDHEIIQLANLANPKDLNAIVNLIETITQKYTDRSLILVIDELGKHLEYAASHPDDNDVYLLQLIAEFADRSSQPKMSFITILHQAFENYGNRLLRTQREEFAKIQGRFEDIVFQIPPEETIKIIGSAVSKLCIDENSLQPVRKVAEQIGSELYDLGAISPSLSKEAYLSICRQCAPLHPIVVLILGPLFRHFAQNERSLFSLLSSNEPYGFQRFLDETELDTNQPRLYGLSELYDYIASSLGSSIYHSSFGRRWALMETAIDRVPDSHLSAKELVKAIGLITSIPTRQLVASKRVLELALGSPIDKDISYLMNRSIVVYRRFSNSYRLWNGSDIDVEALIDDARRSVGVPPLVESLMKLVPPKPITARKHSMQTGALRWFEMIYLSPDQIQVIEKDLIPKDADGKIYVVISSAEENIPSSIPSIKDWQMVLWIKVPSALVEAVHELYYVRWVMANTPALLDDEIARREITERERELEHFIERILNGVIFQPKTEIVLFTKQKIEIITGNQLNTKVSEMCDHLYHKSPRIVNEFVNRNVLSSAATAARNDVLRRMVEFPYEEKLGITGYPPQLPIYLSTLERTGLHKKVGDKWEFCPPEKGSPWYESWNFIEATISDSYCSIGELWKNLSLPPFGIRKGLLPILTVAFICANRNRVSLLENNSFIPEFTAAHIERMIKNPEHFKIRLSNIDGIRKTFIELMVKNGALKNLDGDFDLLSLVRPLIVFAQRLPEYTKNTKLLDQQTTAVRQVLLNAKEPSEFLFYELPAAVGFPPIEDRSIDQTTLPQIVSKIIDSIRDLAQCYPRLLDQIQSDLFEAFGLSHLTQEDAINQIRQKAALLQHVVNDMDLKAILWRLSSQESERNLWLESVASVIMKKTPKNWFDRTIEEFRLELNMLARKLAHYETIASVHFKENKGLGPIRIGITTPDLDFETVIHLPDDEKNNALKIVEDLLEKTNLNLITDRQLLFIASELVKNYYTKSQSKGDAVHG